MSVLISKTNIKKTDDGWIECKPDPDDLIIPSNLQVGDLVRLNCGHEGAISEVRRGIHYHKGFHYRTKEKEYANENIIAYKRITSRDKLVEALERLIVYASDTLNSMEDKS